MAVNITFDLYKTVKVIGKNEVEVYFKFSLPILLTSNNFIITISGVNTTLTVESINLTHYKVLVAYSATVQKATMTVRIVMGNRRLLAVVSSTINFTFDFTIVTFPPANFYPEETYNLHKILGILLKVISLATLALSLLSYIGVKRTPFYSIEALNLLVVIYVSQGYGLNDYIDWLGYVILNMKESTLISGIALPDCQCPKIDALRNFGHSDQFT